MRPTFSFFVATLFLTTACSDQIRIDTPPETATSSSTSGSGGASTSNTSTTTSSGTTTTGTTAGAGGHVQYCGGNPAEPQSCAPDQFCNYAFICDADDSGGICAPRPDSATCPQWKVCPGSCGCDGTWYCDACRAHAAGTDVYGNGTDKPVCNGQTCPCGCCDAAGLCMPGTENFACGKDGSLCSTCGDELGPKGVFVCDAATRTCELPCTCGDGICNSGDACQENAEKCPADCKSMGSTCVADTDCGKGLKCCATCCGAYIPEAPPPPVCVVPYVNGECPPVP